jgi:ligand-binding sensor domain-containing protein
MSTKRGTNQRGARPGYRFGSSRRFQLPFTGFRDRIRMMKEKRWISGSPFPAVLCLAVLAFFTGSAAALSPFEMPGNVQCDFWQTSDGLPDHDVVSLAQTSDGYIWAGTIGSSNSLVRFNGFEFVPAVRFGRGVTNAPTCLAAGKTGGLWISKASRTGGLMLWRQGTAAAVEIRLPHPVSRGIPLYEDRGGNLWIGGEGLLVRAPEGQVKDLNTVAKDFGGIRQMAEDRDGALWLAADRGLVRYRNGAFDQPYPITQALFSVYSSEDGSLWMGTDIEPGLFQVTPAGTIIQYGEAQGQLKAERISDRKNALADL